MSNLTKPGGDALDMTDFSPRSSQSELDRRGALAELFKQAPFSDREMVYAQLSLFMSRQELSRLLALADIYQRLVLPTNGLMMEFGTCYGRTAAALLNLRGIFEPFNFTRRLVVFDTFEGLKGTGSKDGNDRLAVDGAYTTPSGYETYLDSILTHHESEAPISHLKKFEIIKGNASETVPAYLESHPEAIISFAYFDFDIYKPTRDVLMALLPRCPRNAVIAFDQLNCPQYPGETVALAEAVGLRNCSLHRSPLTPWLSYMLLNT